MLHVKTYQEKQEGARVAVQIVARAVHCFLEDLDFLDDLRNGHGKFADEIIRISVNIPAKRKHPHPQAEHTSAKKPERAPYLDKSTNNVEHALNQANVSVFASFALVICTPL